MESHRSAAAGFFDTSNFVLESPPLRGASSQHPARWQLWAIVCRPGGRMSAAVWPKHRQTCLCHRGQGHHCSSYLALPRLAVGIGGYLLITHEHIAETVANLGTKTTSGRPARNANDVRGNWPARSGRCSDYLPGVGVIADVVYLANVGTTFHASLASEPPPSITEWCES